MQRALTVPSVRKANRTLSMMQSLRRNMFCSGLGMWSGTRMALRRIDHALVASPRSAPQIEIEASVIGGGLGIEPSQVQAQLENGKISTLCERGVGEDEGRYRVTFYYGKQRLRILLDSSGNIVDASGHP